MKFFKLSLLLVVFSTIFLLGFSESKSCQDVTVSMTVFNCPFDVEFCVDCPIGPAPGTISINRIIISDPTCFSNTGHNLGDLYQEIWLMANNYEFINFYLCQAFNAPPCPTQSTEISFNHWICWKVQCFEYFGEIVTDVVPCEYDSYCKETWTWCYYGPDDKYISTPGIPTFYGDPDCDLKPYEITIPTVPGTESDCFEMPTACNP